jgi:hypothetical protein
MPGNETVAKGKRAFLPTIWMKNDFTAGQTVGVAMLIAGFPTSIVAFPLLRKTSVLSVGILLSAPVTAGFIRFELTKNGVATGNTMDMNAAAGTRKLWEFEPGALVGNKGDEVGVLWGSNGTLAPSGSIDGVLFFEVQDA